MILKSLRGNSTRQTRRHLRLEALEVRLVPVAPTNTIPGPQVTQPNTSLVFSVANGNQMSVSDPDGPGPFEIELNSLVNGAPSGSASVASTAGLTVTGNGTSLVRLIGTLANVNNALANVTYTPPAGFEGTATLRLESDDLNGAGGLQDVDNISITVAPAVFTVTNTNDSGAGSLRKAITDANDHPNSGGPERIHFNIAGAGVHTIQPGIKLPDINDPVVIDGYTQPGASANTLAVGNNAVLLIEINGANAGETSGLVVSSPDTIIRGLVVNGFRKGTSSTAGRGIAALGAAATNVAIVGNFIGVNPSGSVAVPNENVGVFVLSADGARVGGPDPADRNVISGNLIRGVFANAADVQIKGNYIGTNAAGTAAIPNTFDGVFVAKNTGYQIGGAGAGEGNVISGNGFSGITLNGVNNSFVQGNKIGVGAAGTTPLGNGDTGLFISNQAANNIDNQIGGPTTAANTIAFSGKNGIMVEDPGASGNRFQQNSIFENGLLGIDLDNDGVTPNDAGDADTGANNLLNAPVLTQLTVAGTTTKIAGKISSVPNTAFRIELFSSTAADRSLGAEGQIFLGFVDVTTNGTGVALFTFDHPAAVPAGTPVTATATRPDTGDTSEFSNAVGGPRVSPTTIVYQDQDGDRVTLKFSKPVLNAATIAAVLKFNTGGITDATTVAHQLQTIDLNPLGTLAKGVSLTVTANRDPVTGGDGFAAVGQILTFVSDLGAVTIDGDLGRILAGDGTATTPGLTALTARSIGRFGILTGAVDLHTSIRGAIGTLTVKADVKEAFIEATGAIGTIKITGDLIGGSTVGATNPQQAGHIRAKRIGKLTIGGSLIAGTKTAAGVFDDNGTIRVADDIGSLTIGNIIGNVTNFAVITARGSATPTATSDVAIGTLRVKGRVELAQILAGFDFGGTARNADAQIGTVTVGGDWVASSIAAGAVSGNGFFGDTGDAKMSGGSVKNETTVSSQIKKITIAGQALGSVTAGDHFGIVAESVGVVKIGGVTFPTNPDNSTDDFSLGVTGDLKVNEV